MIVKTEPIILKKPDNRYYFSEIVDKRLMKISNDLDVLFRDIMSKPKFLLNESNPHHVTIGYKNTDDENISNVIGKTIGDIECNKVCVSIKGIHGTCLDILETIYLHN